MKTISKEVVNRLKDKLKNTSNILILSHYHPDGDAVGAVLSMSRFFRKMGYKVSAVLPDASPASLEWMNGVEDILIFEREPERIEHKFSEADLIFALDFNDPSRLKGMEPFFERSGAIKVVIDHHPEPEKFSDITISDTSASSACELLYEFMKSVGGANIIDKEIATSLFVGIMTDTGCFSFNSSDPGTYKRVAELLDYGIKKDEIFNLVYDNYSDNRMRLLGYVLKEKMEVIPEYNTAFISLTMDELERYSFVMGDTEGFVNYPLSISGIRFSALFIEKPDHVKISFRSKGDFPTNLFSKKHFNGGGHLNAAGGELYDNMEETLRLFRSLLPGYAKELK